MTELTAGNRVAVRCFAAAQAAAGSDSATLTLSPGASVDELACEPSGQSDEMALAIQKCSHLCDGVAVRDRRTMLRAGQTVDVPLPFAGGWL